MGGWRRERVGGVGAGGRMLTHALVFGGTPDNMTPFCANNSSLITPRLKRTAICGREGVGGRGRCRGERQGGETKRAGGRGGEKGEPGGRGARRTTDPWLTPVTFRDVIPDSAQRPERRSLAAVVRSALRRYHVGLRRVCAREKLCGQSCLLIGAIAEVAAYLLSSCVFCARPL